MTIKNFLDNSLRICENNMIKYVYQTAEVMPEYIDFFSGILDIKNKKIYENDIIKCDFCKKGIVYFEKGVFWVLDTSSNNKKELYMVKNPLIIGNFYNAEIESCNT